MAESTVCWNPIAAPLRRPPSSAAIVNESPFHAIDIAVATTSAGTSSQAARVRDAATARA